MKTKTANLPAIGSNVILNSWRGVVFTVVSHGMVTPDMIHVAARVPRGILRTSASVGDFKLA